MMNAKSSVLLTLIPVLLFALVLAAAGLLIVSTNILLLIFAGILFGVFLNNLSRGLADRTPLSYPVSFLLIITLMFVLIGLGTFYLGSQVVQRTDVFWEELRSATQQAGDRLQQYEWAAPYLNDPSNLPEMVAKRGTDLLPTMWGGFQSLIWISTCGLVIFFVGLYGAYDPELYRDGLVKLISQRSRPRAREALDNLRSALGRWIVGRLMSMSIVGVLTAIGLWILGVPLAGTLGVVAAFLTFIPNFGPLLAALPQVLLALDGGVNTVIYVVVFNVVLQGVESYLITPIIQKHEVELPPVLTIAAQLLLGALIGVMGVMMAAPLVVVAMTLVHTFARDEHDDEVEVEKSTDD